MVQSAARRSENIKHKYVRPAGAKIVDSVDVFLVIAPQAQLFETGKDRRVETEALFKQVVNERHPDHVLSLDAQ